jgi:hypothetical protein
MYPAPETKTFLIHKYIFIYLYIYILNPFIVKPIRSNVYTTLTFQILIGIVVFAVRRFNL